MDLSSTIVAEAIVALKSRSPIGKQEQKRIHANLCPLTNASVKFLVCPLSECQRLIDKLKEGPRAANVIVARVMIQTGKMRPTTTCISTCITLDSPCTLILCSEIATGIY